MEKKKKPVSGGAGTALNRLSAIMDRLLGPEGCSWDRKQTHESLLTFLREETAEVEQAVLKRDWENLEEELGDLLLQVLFHSALAERGGLFSLEGVLCRLEAKLIRRHPHVFGDRKGLTEREVLEQWGRIKQEEKKGGRDES